MPLVELSCLFFSVAQCRGVLPAAQRAPEPVRSGQRAPEAAAEAEPDPPHQGQNKQNQTTTTKTRSRSDPTRTKSETETLGNPEREP